MEQTQEPRFEQFETDDINFSDPNEINREAARFIFFGGDIIPPAQKRESALMRRGGEYLGQDFKTLRLTKGALWQCNITPMVKAYDHVSDDLDPDHKLASEGFVHTQAGGGVGAIALHNVLVYPGDEIKGLIRPGGNQKGIVELTKLQGLEPKDKDTFQEFFFPNWRDISLGIEMLPVKTSEIRAIIVKGVNSTSDEDLRLTGEQMLSSLDQYFDWGVNYLKVYTQLVKTPINQGHVHTYGAIAEMLFTQLEIRREDLITKEQDIADIMSKAGNVGSEDMLRVLNKLAENQGVMERFLMNQTSGIQPASNGEPVVLDAAKCSAITGKGTQCSNDIVANGRCALPTHKQ